MLPLRDATRPHRRPWITWALIAINVAVFVFSLGRDDTTFAGYAGGGRVAVNGFDATTLEFGFTPCELRAECAQPDRGEVYPAGSSALPSDRQSVAEVRVPSEPVYLTLLTAMFMHGGWVHLLGNMLFLTIFGPRVEDAMPRGAYLVFYLVCGVAASLTQWLFDPGSPIPNIGASGAIAGVLGGYLALYPRARVLTALTLVPLFFYLVEIPAVLVLLCWFGLQVLSGSAALVAPDQSFGVAYFAHVGGFVAGLVLARPVATRWRRRRREARAIVTA